MRIQLRYQPGIQEWGLAEAWVGVQWAAGRKTAQRESAYERTRISENQDQPPAWGQPWPVQGSNVPTCVTVDNGPLQRRAVAFQARGPTAQMLFSF